MPILALKDNPPCRFPEKSIIDSIPFWWIAKVFPKQEKAFAFDLLKMEIEYYLPLYTKVVKRKDNGKLRKSIHPLFPSYVPFVSEESPFKLLKNKRISTIMTVKCQKRFKKELNQIYLANECGVSIEPVTDIQFEIGQKVKIKAGFLAGTIGNIVKIGRYRSLVLSVNSLGQAVVKIEIDKVEHCNL